MASFRNKVPKQFRELKTTPVQTPTPGACALGLATPRATKPRDLVKVMAHCMPQIRSVSLTECPANLVCSVAVAKRSARAIG